MSTQQKYDKHLWNDIFMITIEPRKVTGNDKPTYKSSCLSTVNMRFTIAMFIANYIYFLGPFCESYQTKGVGEYVLCFFS